jgi:outer membrane receptor protein involved in Fe transport
MRMYLLFLSLFICSITFAQNTITGTIIDSSGKPIPGANVRINGDRAGTASNFEGSFTLNPTKNPPFTISVSIIGFESKEVNVTSTDQKLTIQLSAGETQLNEIVVSASRAPERIIESPVTIERMTAKDVKKTAAPSFYDGLENLKEVQMNTSSMSFKSINTRGFATVANTRFMQLVDGMDNSSPLLNFVLGNLIGVSEIDVQSVELLPGASSALYGANAFNGILFMTSKSPFASQGISTYFKYGQTSQKAAGQNQYYDIGIRAAHAFSKHIAGKANMTFMKGTDWFATDYSDKTVAGRDRSSFAYDGLNVYGDEAAVKIGAAGLPDEKVSRTGFKETELTDNKVTNTKVDLSLHIKPWANDFEIILQSKFGFGNTVYQGASRYYLNNFFMQQHKIEFKGKNFFVRGYTTTEDGGQSYDMTFTALNINRTFKSDKNWFTDYATAYSQSVLAGQLSENAHVQARRFADYNESPAVLTAPLVPAIDPTNPSAPRGIRYEPGTPEFKSAFNKVIADSNILTGSKLVDNSRIYHSDVNYNFKDLFEPAEIQVGGSYRVYKLNSFGRIYTDAINLINYNEYGIYTQIQKKLLNDKLKLTGSVRYDKAKNFDGNFSPRISAVYALDESKKHVFRASFQTGFRNPSTQDQYIGFNIGNAVLLGSAKDNLERYVETLPINTPVGQAFAGGATATITGATAYNNSYTASSAAAFGALASTNPVAAAALLRKTNVGLVKPETVRAIDLGYRGQFKGFAIDINGYYNVYNNFLGNVNALAPLYGTAQDSPSITADPTDLGFQTIHAITNGNTRAFQLYTNTDLEIKSIGVGIGVSKKVYQNFELSANYNYAQFDFDKTSDPSFEAGFNTPKHRAKATLSNDKLFGRLGVSISGRWNSDYTWESSFADGKIAEATVIDAQANYNMPKLKSTFKIGATNIGGKEYGQVIGSGLIGQQMYASWTINP